MRFTLFAAAAMVALGQPVYAQDTAQKNAEKADTQAQMEADGKKTQAQSDTQESDTRTVTTEARRHLRRRPGGYGGGMNSHAGDNNGRGTDELDPIRGTAVGQP